MTPFKCPTNESFPDVLLSQYGLLITTYISYSGMLLKSFLLPLRYNSWQSSLFSIRENLRIFYA